MTNSFEIRMQTMLAEFHAIVDHALLSDDFMRGWRAKDVVYDAVAGSIRPLTTGVPDGRAEHPSGEPWWTADRKMTVELAARTIEIRSRRFNRGTVFPVSDDWQAQLRQQYPGMFDCEMSIGPGWADLLVACVEMRSDQGERPRFSQIKEKLGSLRLYEHDLDSPLEWIADLLSTCICEECGAPGRQRKGGWIKTECDYHAAERAR